MSIFNIRYGGRGRRRVNGGEEEVVLPPALVLQRVGAFVHQVTITHPQSVADIMENEGREVPSASVRALIDTGAFSTIITPEVAEQLALVHTGQQTIRSVQDEQEQPVYFGRIIFPWGGAADIPIAACPLEGIDCLVGREILSRWHFTYNGPDGSVTICD
jgi:predicted aspartyl protease